MTAVAPLPSAPRPWSSGSDTQTEVFLPRSRGPPRPVENAWGSLGGKKKPTASRAGSATPTNGIANNNNGNHMVDVWRGGGGGGGVANGTNGVSAQPVLPSNGVQQPQGGQQVYLMLLPLNGTFERKQIPLPFYPETMRIGRQTNAKTQPQPGNGFFDSKVLSRQHAEIWADKQTGKVWIRDIKSSNGTFVNGQRLSQENQESEPHGLHAEDVLELGIDIVGEDNKTIVHRKVAARVEHAGVHSGGNFELSFGDDTSGVPTAQTRGRGGSAGRGGTTNGLPQPHRIPQVMVPAVTLEMVVKKLNAELQCAKQQSHDLHRTADLFDRLLSTPPKPAPTQPASNSSLAFLPPIAPATTSLTSPNKPLPASPPPPQQLLSLVDALAKARKEMESKTLLITTLERTLASERLAREAAESRAAQLESASRAIRGKSRELLLREVELERSRTAPTTPPTTAPPTPIDTACERELENQRAIAEMVEELKQTRERMEAFRLRAETAERQRDEEREERTSLSEMVATLRKAEDERARSRADTITQTDPEKSVILLPRKSKEKEKESAHTRLAAAAAAGKPPPLLVQRHALPYASVIGVMIFGVGIMSLLNSWQHGGMVATTAAATATGVQP